MTEPTSPSPANSSSQWNDLDDVLEQFEYAWQSGSPPSIDTYRQMAVADPQALLGELAYLDLAWRLRGGEAIRVENYLERYPELASNRDQVVQLIAVEYKLRCSRESDLTADEFLQRFPQYREDLSEQLSGPHRPQTWAPTRLNCPQCRRPVTVEGDAKAQEISCSGCGHSFRVEASHSPEEPPVELTQLDQFQLLGVVGQGGFGTVYRARDTQLDRIVAIKVPRNLRGGSWETERFLREARSAAQLAHPGIVPTYAVGRAGTLPYIVSAFIQGRTLAEEMADRRLGFREAAGLIAQVAQTLAYAHGQGVVHRDLKPSNIMLGQVEESERRKEPRPDHAGPSDEVRAFVMDFGLARRDEGEVRVTLDGQILGTPLYMSPEQARGEGNRADARSDVYSLGVILYEMLTGEAPFRGTAQAVFRQIVENEPQPPRRLNDKIPRDLETIALKCLAKESGRRYQTAADLAADLGRFLADQPILARPVGRPERTWRWARRNPRMAALTGSVIGLIILWLIGATVAAIVIYQQREIAVQATADATTAKLQAEGERDRAEKSLNQSLKTLHQFTSLIQEGLRNYPTLSRWKESLLRTGLAGLEELTRTANTSSITIHQAIVHASLGDILLSLGETAKAREEYEHTFALMQALNVANPRPKGIDTFRYVVYERLGKVSRLMGEMDKAQALYQQALEVAQAWANSPLARENIESYLLLRSGVEDILPAQGDSAIIRERSPVTADARCYLIFTWNALGEISLDRGDRAAARQRFQDALKVAEEVVALYPDTTKPQTLLAMTCNNLGNLELQSRRPAAALEYYQRSLGLYETKETTGLKSFSTRMSLATSYWHVGDAYRLQGRRREALDLYQKSVEQYQELAKRDPSNRNIQSSLAIGYDRLSSIKNLLGDLPAALDYTQKSLEKYEELAAADPENVHLKQNLAIAYYNVGQLAMQTYAFDRAARSYQQVLEVLQRLLHAGKLTKSAELQRLLRASTRMVAIAKLAPRAVENLASALWASEESPPAFSAGLVGLLAAPQGQGPWLAAAELFPGRVSPADRVRELLQIRAAVLARRGRFAEAEITAEALRATAPKDKMVRYNVACAYAACVAAVTQGEPAGRLTPEQEARRRHYADLAVTALKEAVDLGFTNRSHIVTDRDLIPIFREKGFIKLVEDLEKKQAAKGK